MVNASITRGSFSPRTERSSSIVGRIWLSTSTSTRPGFFRSQRATFLRPSVCRITTLRCRSRSTSQLSSSGALSTIGPISWMPRETRYCSLGRIVSTSHSSTGGCRSTALAMLCTPILRKKPRRASSAAGSGSPGLSASPYSSSSAFRPSDSDAQHRRAHLSACGRATAAAARLDVGAQRKSVASPGALRSSCAMAVVRASRLAGGRGAISPIDLQTRGSSLHTTLPAHRTRGMTDVNPRQLELCSAPGGEFLKKIAATGCMYVGHLTHV